MFVLQVHRMWLVTCIVALLVLVGQYHVSTSWLSAGHVALDGSADADAMALSAQCDFAAAEVLDALRAALRKLVDDNAVDAAVEARLLKEVADKVRSPWAPTPTPSPTPPTDQTTTSTLSTPSAVTSPPQEVNSVQPQRNSVSLT